MFSVDFGCVDLEKHAKTMLNALMTHETKGVNRSSRNSERLCGGHDSIVGRSILGQGLGPVDIERNKENET